MTRAESRYQETIPTRKGFVYVDVQKKRQKKYRLSYAYGGVVQEMATVCGFDDAIFVAKELANVHKEVWVK
ncbi:hypothetical protein [Mesotoga sp. UBA6090]|uniref:hypothetical protein n=1 Tax=Mesotoga sp. UBA6090 TaxID=1946860 RepID=UPI0025E31EA4|nr:hypothetical protein [Mesotoga sp. UBA6090]